MHFIHIYANQIIFKSIILLKYCFLWPLCKGHCPQGPGRARHTCASYHQSLSNSSAHLCSSLALQGMMILETLLMLNAHLCFSKAVSDSLAHLSFTLHITHLCFSLACRGWRLWKHGHYCSMLICAFPRLSLDLWHTCAICGRFMVYFIFSWFIQYFPDLRMVVGELSEQNIRVSSFPPR